MSVSYPVYKNANNEECLPWYRSPRDVRLFYKFRMTFTWTKNFEEFLLWRRIVRLSSEINYVYRTGCFVSFLWMGLWCYFAFDGRGVLCCCCCCVWSLCGGRRLLFWMWWLCWIFWCCFLWRLCAEYCGVGACHTCVEDFGVVLCVIPVFKALVLPYVTDACRTGVCYVWCLCQGFHVVVCDICVSLAVFIVSMKTECDYLYGWIFFLNCHTRKNFIQNGEP